MTNREVSTERVGAELYPSADAWVEEDGKVFLVGGQCPRCGKCGFPRPSFCDECGNRAAFESVRLSRTGTLYSFTEVHVAPEAFEVPYVIGYVDLPEGVRVCGQLEQPAAELELDEPVEVVLGLIRTSETGQPVISYKFRKRGGIGSA